MLICYYEVDENPNNYWLLFDLADTLLFLGEKGKSIKTFNEAVKLIPVDERNDKMNTVLGPWRDFLIAGVLNDSTKALIEEIIIPFNPN